jgi:ABC-2 type transport system permease protein
MLAFLSDTLYLLQRHLRATLRLPIWIAVMLVQPIIWLTIYGQLFRRVIELPGFESASYIQFLTPGVVVMTAFFGAMFSGMGMIEDLDAGVIDRLLATPVHRGALIAARVLHDALTIAIQAIIILALGLALGARVPGGVAGFLVIVLVAALLGAGMGAVSNGLALLTQRRETLIAVNNFFGMPLIFLSSAFMAVELMPDWIRLIARGNPVNWAVEAARAAMLGQAWPAVWSMGALLAALVLVACIFATQSFRLYRRAS